MKKLSTFSVFQLQLINRPFHFGMLILIYYCERNHINGKDIKVPDFCIALFIAI